jgi:ferrous iron transport protein B
MIIPLMSCGARFPVYALIIPAFFAPSLRAPVLWLIYVLGIILAVAMAKFLRITLLRGESHPLVMELPPYRVPTLKGLAIHAGERSWMYVKKAGSVILAASLILWFVSNWPAPSHEELVKAGSPAAARELVLTHSLAGRMGRAMEPLLKPVGFDWRVGTALVGAAASKEIFIAQMGIAFGVGESSDTSAALRERLRAGYSGLSGFCILIFVLIASPCIATCAVVRRESGSWKWSALQWVGLTIMGYVAALVIFQLGSLVGL